MLDQSFYFKNIYEIFEESNRKGVNVENPGFFEGTDFFIDSRKLSEDIKRIKGDIKLEIGLINDKKSTYSDYTKVNVLQDKLAVKEAEKENVLNLVFKQLSETVNSDSFKLILSEGRTKKGKKTYVVNNIPESYFVSKQVQKNIRSVFNVKQDSRSQIVSRLITILKDGFPKIIVRTDIKDFYESIPHSELLSLVNNNTELSIPSKKIIRGVLSKYWEIQVADGLKLATDDRVGIPRGVGISAYLGELYLNKLDERFEKKSHVSFYSRYVDDILMIITPTDRDESKTTQDYKKELVKEIHGLVGVKVNLQKTKLIDLRKRSKDRKSTKKYVFNYLGYDFILGYKIKGNMVIKQPIEIRLSELKLARYKQKVEMAFSEFDNLKLKYLLKDRGLKRNLIQRIKFLTSNYQLFRMKKNVFIGIYFSNEFLSSPLSDLKILDKYLSEKIETLEGSISDDVFIKKLKSYSFVSGFEKKEVKRFRSSSQDLQKIMKIWSRI